MRAFLTGCESPHCSPISSFRHRGSLLSEGGSATLAISLDKTPPSNVTVSLAVPEESRDDIAVSPEQVILSPGRLIQPVTITASEDDELEPRETHVLQAQSPVALSTEVTIETLPDVPPQAQLCARLGHHRRELPDILNQRRQRGVLDGVVANSGAAGGSALRSGMTGDDQRSCLSAALERPARVAFRWRVSSEARLDYVYYIDDGRRDSLTRGVTTGAKLLSGEVAWRDASFEYPGDGPFDVEWCYVKDLQELPEEEDSGFLDRLQITPLNNVIITPSQVTARLRATARRLTLSLDETPRSNVTVNLTVPEESMNDIAISSTQACVRPRTNPPYRSPSPPEKTTWWSHEKLTLCGCGARLRSQLSSQS